MGAPAAAEGKSDELDLAGYLAPTHLNWLDAEPERPWREVEATYVFGDVSGFTALGERLARKGRIGSETLTDAITAVFTAMHEAVSIEGGEILKFGGDAVLAMFTGMRHEARGAAAALGMQDALRAVRIPGIAASRRRLSMSVGVASGIAHLFLAGRAPRELMVAGPLASEVVTREGQAQAGEVLLSPNALANLPPEFVIDAGADRGARLIARPPTNPVPPPAVPSDADPTAGLPPHLHRHQPDAGEHRSVAIAFVKLGGSDELIARSGPEALSEALDHVVGAVASACREWGIALVSSDVDADGAKLILSAGAPVASPDDDDRMLHALRDVVDIESPLAIRVGVNRGPVFTADIGPRARRVWSLLGDDVNLAARVMSRAERGTVLATPSVLRGVRDAFERTPIPPFEVKGKKAPVHAEVVGPARGRRQEDEEARGRLIGRKRELAALRSALEGARSGERQAIEVVGEPGVGKSHLTAEVRAEASDMTLLHVQGGPYAARTPYLAIRRALRTAVLPGLDENADAAAPLADRVNELDPGLERWLPLIGLPFGIEFEATEATRQLAPEFVPERMARAVGRLLDLALPPEALLALVEDAHWLDRASAALLSILFKRPPDADGARGRGFLALVTRRPGPSPFAELDLTTMELAPLGDAASRELLEPRSEEDAVFPAAVRERLVERARGNPLLLLELVAAARNGAALDELPESVEALMNARMDTLPRDERRVLREASIIGNEVQVSLLAEMAGREPGELEPTIERLRDFLVPVRPGTVRFSHALMHDAAYAALPFRLRRQLHARAGSALEHRGGEGLEGLLAIHYGAARRWAETWRYGRLAGERAMERAAPVEATGFLRSAVDAARWLRPRVPSDELARVTARLGEAAELAGSHEEARKAYARARALIRGDKVAEAELFLREGRLREGAGTLPQALRYYTRGIKALGGARSHDARVARARLVLARGATRLRGGHHRKALPHLEQAVREAEKANDQSTLGHAYYLLEWAHSDLGNPEAGRYRDLSLPIFEELGDFDKQGRVLTNLGVTAYHEGRWTEAVDLYGRATEAAERAGDAVGTAFNINNLAEIRLEQGRVDESEQLLREALGTWRAAGFGAGVGTVLRNLGRVEMRRGKLDLAAELFQRGRETLTGIGAAGLVCELDAYEAKRLILTGDPEAAKLLAEEIQQRARKIAVIPALPAFLARVCGVASVLANRREAGVELLRDSVALARSAEAAYDEALGLDALATVLESQGGGESLRAEAEALFERLDVVAPPATGLNGIAGASGR